MNTAPELKPIIAIAEKAGQAILELYPSDLDVTLKDDQSPVTKADLAANSLIVEALEKLTPDIPCLSEESTHAAYEIRRHWTRYWLIDPLDGTKEFIKKNGEFTVNIALIERGKPTQGVVHVPAINQTYWGIVGEGAWRKLGSAASSEKIPIKSSERPYRVLVSGSHLTTETKEYVAELKKIHPNLELVSAGSSLKICRIAEGSADLYPRLGPTMEWDTAAAHAVLNAAGGTLLHFDRGEELSYNKQDMLNPWFIATPKR